MINTVVLTGTVIEVGSCEPHVIGVIEVNDEHFYILFDIATLPEPIKILNKYVNVNGTLKHFKHKKFKKDEEYTVDVGIFVRRLEVYDI